jgi:hypothetical protein
MIIHPPPSLSRLTFIGCADALFSGMSKTTVVGSDSVPSSALLSRRKRISPLLVRDERASALALSEVSEAG